MSEQITNGAPETTRERFHRTLQERAQSVKCVRNDVYTVKYWQLALNFFMGAGAVVLLILSMAMDAPVSTACLISALVAVAAVVVLNLALRAVAPMSFLQYTAVEKDKRYVFMVLSKHRSLFTNGEDTVEFDRLEYVKSTAAPFPQYRFDFFADMDVDLRIGKA
ncbi:MAG: hypothetical protein K2M48_06575, partial [Clostridiales bacterium]|nr:hypothetical protein [Clostridiales bacterium]